MGAAARIPTTRSSQQLGNHPHGSACFFDLGIQKESKMRD